MTTRRQSAISADRNFDDNAPEAYRAVYSDLEHDYPFLYPTDMSQKPILVSTVSTNPVRPIDANQVTPIHSSVQRPKSLVRNDDRIGNRFTYDHLVNETPKPHGHGHQSMPKVSFANGDKIKIPIDKSKSPRHSPRTSRAHLHPPDHRRLSNQQKRLSGSVGRRPSRRYSVVDQPTVGGKICAIWRNIYTKLHLKEIAFILVLIGYALLGGLLFSWLEMGHTRQTNEKLVRDLHQEREHLTDEIFRIINEPWLYPDYALQRKAIVDKLNQYQYDRGLGPKAKPVWDLWDGVFYSFTIFTTIGYGHYTPVTKMGRIATILYALVGIPLLLAILADFGRLLTKALRRMWSFVRNTIRRFLAMKRFKKLQDAAQRAGLDLEDDDLDGIAAEDIEVSFPIPLALFLIISWLFICAAFFLIWERKWTYFEAFYFFFISLSTIGLGDLVPEHQKYMIANFPFVLIGLSLVTLVINLIQNKIEEMKEKAQMMLEDQLGLEDSDVESESEQLDQRDQIVWPKPIDPQDDNRTIPSTPGSPISPRPDTPESHTTDRMSRQGSTRGSKRRKPQERFNLGIIQTFKLPKNRRRIGTQTDDSFVRDVIYRERRPMVKVGSTDRYSVATGNSEYYDADESAQNLC